MIPKTWKLSCSHPEAYKLICIGYARLFEHSPKERDRFSANELNMAMIGHALLQEHDGPKVEAI